MIKPESFTRREFLAGTGLLLAGTTLKLDAAILLPPPPGNLVARRLLYENAPKLFRLRAWYF